MILYPVTGYQHNRSTCWNEQKKNRYFILIRKQTTQTTMSAAEQDKQLHFPWTGQRSCGFKSNRKKAPTSCFASSQKCGHLTAFGEPPVSYVLSHNLSLSKHHTTHLCRQNCTTRRSSCCVRRSRVPVYLGKCPGATLDMSSPTK